MKKREEAAPVAPKGMGYFINRVSGTLFLRHAQVMRNADGQISGEVPEVSVKFTNGFYVPIDDQGCTAEEIKQMIMKSENFDKHTFWIPPGGNLGKTVPQTAEALDAETPTCRFCGIACRSEAARDAHEKGCSQK